VLVSRVIISSSPLHHFPNKLVLAQAGYTLHVSTRTHTTCIAARLHRGLALQL
jgi:hypothetical protein